MAQFITVTERDTGGKLFVAVSGIRLVSAEADGTAFLETYVDKRMRSYGIHCRESFDEVVAAIIK